MKRRYLLLAVLVSSVLLLAGFQAGGLRHMVTARLSGYGENLPVSTAATGEFTAAISHDNTMIEYTLSYSNLEGGPAIGAHIHFGQWWSNGGVIAFLC